jgi:RHS repeat-associated protein
VAERVNADAPVYLLADHLGSTTTMLNSAGQVVNGPQQYYPYGKLRQCCAGTDKSFTGHQLEDYAFFDTAEDLYFMKARFYDPTVGRFLQPDSIVPDYGNPQSLNRYSYVLNNPLKYTDPTGYWGCGWLCRDKEAGVAPQPVPTPPQRRNNSVPFATRPRPTGPRVLTIGPAAGDRYRGYGEGLIVYRPKGQQLRGGVGFSGWTGKESTISLSFGVELMVFPANDKLGLVQAHVNVDVDKPTGPFGPANYLHGKLNFSSWSGEEILFEPATLQGCFFVCDSNYEVTLTSQYRIPPLVRNIQLELLLYGSNVTQYDLTVNIEPIILYPVN